MIVERITVRAKPGRLRELVELFKAEADRVDAPARICTFAFGPRDVLVDELTFESEDERQSFWDDWRPQPEATEFLKKAYELGESGGNTELLVIH